MKYWHAWLLIGLSLCDTVMRSNLFSFLELKDVQPYISTKPGGRELFSQLRHQFIGQIYYMNAQIDLKNLKLGVI